MFNALENWLAPLFKNVAILGALLLIWAHGPGAYALDNRAQPMGDVQ